MGLKPKYRYTCSKCGKVVETSAPSKPLSKGCTKDSTKSHSWVMKKI